MNAEYQHSLEDFEAKTWAGATFTPPHVLGNKTRGIRGKCKKISLPDLKGRPAKRTAVFRVKLETSVERAIDSLRGYTCVESTATARIHFCCTAQ